MTTEPSEITHDGLSDKARQAIADCPICQGIKDNGGSSHYHCIKCGETCSVMGHIACESEIVTSLAADLKAEPSALLRQLIADQERENGPTAAGELARIAADYRRLVGMEQRVKDDDDDGNTSGATGATCLVTALECAARWLTTLAENGPDLRINAHKKAVHEAVELADTLIPDEWADVAICLVAVAIGQGWSLETLAESVAAKVRVNEARSWLQLPDGTWQHTTGERGGGDDFADVAGGE